jgi:hypothetical protein
VIEDGSGFRYLTVNSGEAKNALPAGNTVGFILRTKNDGTNPAGGGQFIGHRFVARAGEPTTPTARIAFRGYRYWSPNYTFTDGSQDDQHCANSTKVMQFGEGAQLSFILDGGTTSNHQLYGWIGWTSSPQAFGGSGPAQLCCERGPGGSTTWGTYTSAVFSGKWWRFEAVLTNVLTSGAVPMTLKIYRKDVTNNLPEELIIDSTIPTTQPPGNGDWSATTAATWKPSSTRVNEVYFDLFRRDFCNGYIGLTHLMAAAWSTDSGQRIGPACEVEPNAPECAGGQIPVSNAVLSPWESVSPPPPPRDNPRQWHRGVTTLPGQRTGGGLIRSHLLTALASTAFGTIAVVTIIGVVWFLRAELRTEARR